MQASESKWVSRVLSVEEDFKVEKKDDFDKIDKVSESKEFTENIIMPSPRKSIAAAGYKADSDGVEEGIEEISVVPLPRKSVQEYEQIILPETEETIKLSGISNVKENAGKEDRQSPDPTVPEEADAPIAFEVRDPAPEYTETQSVINAPVEESKQEDAESVEAILAEPVYDQEPELLEDEDAAAQKYVGSPAQDTEIETDSETVQNPDPAAAEEEEKAEEAQSANHVPEEKENCEDEDGGLELEPTSPEAEFEVKNDMQEPEASLNEFASDDEDVRACQSPPGVVALNPDAETFESHGNNDTGADEEKPASFDIENEEGGYLHTHVHIVRYSSYIFGKANKMCDL